MIVFEHRIYKKDRRLPFGGMTDEVVAVFHGESQRGLAYNIAAHNYPFEYVVWERNVAD